MRILLTGATGLIGQALAASLAAGGHELHVLSRSPKSAKERLPGVREAFRWSSTQIPPPQVYSGVGAIVNLAGESVVGRWTEAKRKAIVDSRVEGTRNLIMGLREAADRPSVLVSSSAVGYYGDRGEEALTEASQPGEDFLANTSVAWEAEACKARDLGVRVVTLRTGIVLAKQGGALGQMLLPAKLGLTGPLGSGEQWWSWIHLDDLVGLIRFAIEAEQLSGPLNGTAPAPERQKDFQRILGEVLSRPAFLPAPAFMLKLVLGGFSAELLSSKRVLPAVAEQAGYRFAHPQLEGALRAALGH